MCVAISRALRDRVFEFDSVSIVVLQCIIRRMADVRVK